MNKTSALLFCVFTGALLTNAAELMNRSKVDWRIIEVIEKTKVQIPAIQSPVLSKYSQGEPLYSVIVHTASLNEAAVLGIQPRSFNGKLFTATVTHNQLTALSNAAAVSYIEAPRKLYPKLDKSIVEMKVNKLHSGLVNSTVYTGSGVIIGIIDTGIDWKHLDFRKDADTTIS